MSPFTWGVTHISYKLSKYIEQKGYSSVHVNTILKRWNTEDSEISSYVDKNNLVLITKDIDFRNSYWLKKTPKKLIRVNLGNISNVELIKIFNKELDKFSKIIDVNEYVYIDNK